MKKIILFILITVIILLSSCATYRDVERYNEPSFYNYRDPMYFNNTFYHWKGYKVYVNKSKHHWTPIKPTTPKKK